MASLNNDDYRDGCCKNGNCCNRCGLKCLSCYWTFCLGLVIFIWFIMAKYSWNCTEFWESEKETPAPDTNECNSVENWIGTLVSFSMLNVLSLTCRLLIVIVFVFALGRINCLVGSLKKYGFVESRKVLVIHIIVSAIDLAFNATIGMWAFYKSGEDAVNGNEKYSLMYDPKSFENALYVMMIQQVYQVPNQFLMLTVLYYILKLMR